MTLKASGSQVREEGLLEFIRWVQRLKKVRDDFESLLDEYEGKKQKLLDSFQR
jgi:hypothetical protein